MGCFWVWKRKAHGPKGNLNMDNDAKTRTFLGDSGLSQAHGLGHADSHLGRPPFFPGFSRCGVPKNDMWPLPKTCGVFPRVSIHPWADQLRPRKEWWPLKSASPSWKKWSETVPVDRITTYLNDLNGTLPVKFMVGYSLPYTGICISIRCIC